MCFTGKCKYEGLMGECILEFKTDGVILREDAACYNFAVPFLWQWEQYQIDKYKYIEPTIKSLAD